MRINTRLRSDVAIMEPDDRVTVETEPQLTELVRSLIECGQRRFVLDLGGVSYIDSVGLGAIVGAYTAARRRGGDLKLLHLRGHNRHLMTITKLLTVLEAYETEEEAASSFAVDGPPVLA